MTMYSEEQIYNFVYDASNNALRIVGDATGGSGDVQKILLLNLTCTATEEVGDFVYVYGNNEVRQADATDMGKCRNVPGCIYYKADSTTCNIIQTGPAPLFSGLVANEPYYIDPDNPGQITSVYPSAPNITKEMGYAINTTTLVIREKDAVQESS